MDSAAEIFESHRARLVGLAYRMLGSVTEAHDVVQDVYVKWHSAEHATIRDAQAWLTTVCSRLALNRLASARAQREQYVGQWLPEPLCLPEGSAAERAELDETVSMALLAALERLSPTERAAYLLHDVFDYAFAEVAEIVGVSEANARQLATRARRRVAEARPRFTSTTDEHERLVDGFLRAAREGDMESLISLLTPEAVLTADGGGKAKTLLEPLCGAAAVAEFFVQVWKPRDGEDPLEVRRQWVSGAPGVVVRERGVVIAAMGMTIEGGRIAKLYAVRNPEKLRHLQTAV